MGIQDREHLEVSSANELFEWLRQHHNSSPGLWVVTHKKNSGKPAPTYDEIVRTVLCWGWIDSVSGKVDENRSKLYLSPRKPTSAWSLSNKTRVEELIQNGQMQLPGLEKIEQAKTSGMWSLIDSAQNTEIPEDLAEAF